jgi:hypothetical protein
MLQERRNRRSSDSRVALHYQLEHSRHQGGLEALVLADEDGLVVSSSGDRAMCTELAAVAPLMSRAVMGMPLPPLLQGAEVTIRPLTLNGQELFLAAAGGTMARDALLTHSVSGVCRILSCN